MDPLIMNNDNRKNTLTISVVLISFYCMYCIYTHTHNTIPPNFPHFFKSKPKNENVLYYRLPVFRGGGCNYFLFQPGASGTVCRLGRIDGTEFKIWQNHSHVLNVYQCIS